MFAVKKNERFQVILFMVFLTVISMFWTLGATLGDALFLGKLGSGKAQALLPWVYVGIAVTTVISTLGIDLLLQKISKLIPFWVVKYTL